jgi:hypothetical protein
MEGEGGGGQRRGMEGRVRGWGDDDMRILQQQNVHHLRQTKCVYIIYTYG